MREKPAAVDDQAQSVREKPAAVDRYAVGMLPACPDPLRDLYVVQERSGEEVAWLVVRACVCGGSNAPLESSVRLSQEVQIW